MQFDVNHMMNDGGMRVRRGELEIGGSCATYTYVGIVYVCVYGAIQC